MLLPGVDPVQVGVLDVPGPVAPVLLPVLTDPLVRDLVEPVPVITITNFLLLSPHPHAPVIPAPLNVGDGLGQDLGQDRHEGEDRRPGHELTWHYNFISILTLAYLSEFVNAFVNCLELLLLSMKLSEHLKEENNII